MLIAYLLIIAIAFTVIGFSLIQLVGEYLFSQRIKEDQRIADSLAEQIGFSLTHYDVDSMLHTVREICDNETSRVLILDSYGVVQVDTQSQLNGTRFENKEAECALTKLKSDYGFYDASYAENYWIYSTLSAFSHSQAMTGIFVSPVLTDQSISGAVVYISQVQEIFSSLRELQFRILFWLVLVAASVILVSAFLLRTITRPVGELREGIARMSSGDFSARVDVRGRNEFAELATAFNSMTERLGLLDTSRNQFVSNASHELKTPLSTMKILIETLLYQQPFDQDMTKEFLNDINMEIDRLNRIVSDLLTLVHIDSDSMKLNLTELSLNELLIEQVKRLAPLARENGLELDCSARESLTIIGDSVKLQQVIYNVIDNAIKYTPRSGEVHADLTRVGKRAVIRVADSGIGIPAEDLPNIFERFYRVDKARSRATGGTGLGLSIVKQIVVSHGGSIVASSEEGKGSTFTIELPLALK